MSIEENEALARQLVKARNENDVEAFIALLPAEWRERVRHSFDRVTEASPDVQITIEELISEGNKVVCRWSFHGTHLVLYEDIPATGNEANYTGIDIYTVADGMIASLFPETDSGVVCQQLGVGDVSQQRAEL